MMVRRRSLACCTWDQGISIDLDEQDGIITYNGLESCILSNQSYENESGTGTSQGDGFMSDSMDYDDDLSCSSSKDAFRPVSSKWLNTKRDDQNSYDWELSESPRYLHVKSKPHYSLQFSDVENMKETFAKLLLGEDVTGGRNGLSTALALSNGVTNLAASVFGELSKLEPLPQESKNKWRREMDWLLSPTNFMVELVPTRQNGANGRTLEIMTPKARADIRVNLPALQKLDSMLLETLDSMVNTEFWYSEIGSRAGGTESGKQSKRWWLPLPQVPKNGLSDSERKKLLNQSKVVYQVFKAAKAINENVLLEMPIPNIIKDALHKSGKANLGGDLYKILAEESKTAGDMSNSLDLKSEHSAIDVINKLESAIIAWKEKIAAPTNGKSPIRTSWSFVKDSVSEFDKTETLLDRAEALLQKIKTRYLNLPHTFLEATKIQYGKDVGHSILEAYSRVLGNLAFSILCRMGDILQKDASSNPSSPLAVCCFPGILETPLHVLHKPHFLVDQVSKKEGKYRDSDASLISDNGLSYTEEDKGSSINATPSRSRVWCIG